MTYPIRIGTKALIHTDNWFTAPDGRQYQAVFGTVHAVLSSEDTLGVRTNARSTNWYVKIGRMLVAGCQIHYVIETDECELSRGLSHSVFEGKVHEIQTPPTIYSAD